MMLSSTSTDKSALTSRQFEKAVQKSKRWNQIIRKQKKLQEIEGSVVAKKFIEILLELEIYKPKESLEERNQIETIAKENRWDPARFSIYGVTPASTFKAIFSEITQHGFLNTTEDEAEFVVLGSSVGWIAFYARFLFSFQVLGVEIVPYRVQVSAELSRKYALDDRLRFVAQDAQCTDFSHARVVWDSIGFGEVPRSSILQKVSREAPDDVVVVTYEKIPKELEDIYEECLILVEPNSWTPRQRYFVYRKMRHAETKDQEQAARASLGNWELQPEVGLVADAHQSYRYPRSEEQRTDSKMNITMFDQEAETLSFVDKMENMLGVSETISNFL